MSDERKKILVVDDEQAFKELICHCLRGKYDVLGVDGPVEALEALAQKRFDLVLSDVTMPGIKGYELIADVRTLYPGTKVALITAWSVEQCLDLALEYGIGNIIPKGLPFDFDELDLTVGRLFTEDIFGLARYFEPNTTIVEDRLLSTADIQRIRDRTIEALGIDHLPERQRLMLKLVLDEAMINAAYHPRTLPREGDYSFSEEEAVSVSFAKDSSKIGFCVVDRFGTLDTHTILTSLDRCAHPTPENIQAERGRGLFLIRSFVDKMIINIKKGVRTEIITLVHPGARPRDQRPLLITEI